MGRVDVLHEAVAQAIGEAGDFRPGVTPSWVDVAAAVAVRVVLAEAQRSIEALDGYQATSEAPKWVRADDVLAVLRGA